MTERPILFSAPMVRAILSGAKTQTRRPITSVAGMGQVREVQRSDCYDMTFRDRRGRWNDVTFASLEKRSPFGVPGDRLWVREAWAPYGDDIAERGEADVLADAKAQMPWARIVYGADANGGSVEVKRWRPSIHMPRWASRITLEVTGVRVEQLQSISEEDAKAEGVTPFPDDPGWDCWTDGKHKTAFQRLWNEINGWEPDAWDANPWVWVVEFRRVKP